MIWAPVATMWAAATRSEQCAEHYNSSPSHVVLLSHLVLSSISNKSLSIRRPRHERRCDAVSLIVRANLHSSVLPDCNTTEKNKGHRTQFLFSVVSPPTDQMLLVGLCVPNQRQLWKAGAKQEFNSCTGWIAFFTSATLQDQVRELNIVYSLGKQRYLAVTKTWVQSRFTF